MIAAGKFRHRVTIQRPTYTQDPVTGAPGAITWEDVYTGLAADVHPLSARELIEANQLQSKIVARITIRFKDDLTPDMRILHRGAIYNIAGLLPDHYSGLEYMTIPVSSGTNEG